MRHPEAVAARLAIQVVVTVAQFHHPRARELHRHMRDEEALLDRAQFLMVRQQLCFGAMSDARTDFDALREEHERMDVLRRRLERELAHTLALSADAPTVRAALREYVAAFVDHHDFEDALAPTLAPFLDEPQPHS